jgi:polyphosphate kinase
MKSLVMSPVGLREKILSLIEREAALVSQGKGGLIMAKVNSLADEKIVEALYKAASQGVKILLNVRGICTLVPGIPGISENIRVVSIVDRFLEHSRIIYFQNGGDEKIFLSSADWLPRNFDKRIELLFPILQENLKARLKKSLEIYLNDTEKGRYLQSDGTWRKAETPIPESRAQERFLSGEF